MARTLYLMRHGETMFNVQQKIQGWVDSPLTDRGIEQARAAGARLRERGVRIDHAYCSTAERASDTLELVLGAMGQPLPYGRLKALREHYHGTLEGESERINGPVPFDKADEFYRYYGGETFEQTRGRVVPAVREIMARPEHENVLIVSHAGACMMTTQALVGADISKLGFGNCTILVMGYDETRPDAADAFELVDVIQPGL